MSERPGQPATDDSPADRIPAGSAPAGSAPAGSAPAGRAHAELALGLERVLARRWGNRVHVSDLQRLSGGASRETWAFSARVGEQTDPADGNTDTSAGGNTDTSAGGNGDISDGALELILQRERPGGIRTGGGMAAEGRLLTAAAAAGVPVARVVATDADDDSELGAPFIVMERVKGETIPRRLLRDQSYARARSVLARQAGAAAAAIHRMDTRQLDLHAQDQVEQFRQLLDALGEPHPAFELGFKWLEANRPDSGRPTGVVHGDFRTGNLVVGPEGLRAVLDWELAHLGDPVEDLGWFCVRAWRFGSDQRAGGFGPVEELLAGYSEAGGGEVGLDELRWWEAMGTLKWGVMCIIQAATHLNGATRSVELAAIGRRTAENEEDLLQLIAGSDPYQPTPATNRPGATPPHDRPSAYELLEAVGEYLAEVRDGVTGRLGFHARVAANALAIARRELTLGEAQARAHTERLAALGMTDDAALARAIRNGAIEDRLDEVTAAVRASVRDKLAVANPGYWEPHT